MNHIRDIEHVSFIYHMIHKLTNKNLEKTWLKINNFEKILKSFDSLAVMAQT